MAYSSCCAFTEPLEVNTTVTSFRMWQRGGVQAPLKVAGLISSSNSYNFALKTVTHTSAIR